MEPTAFLGLLARTRTTAEPAAALGSATPSYCRMRLLTVTTLEAATAVVARAVAREGGSLQTVADAWTARTLNPITRAHHREQGRAVLALSGLPVRPLPRAVALGAVAASTDIEPEDLARMVGWDDVQNVLATADPGDGRAWAAALVADIRSMAAQVAHLVDPVSIPATGAALFLPDLTGAALT